MMQEIEIEYKNLLTEHEFNQLLRQYFFPKEAVTQTNYYFETKDFLLKENGCALRVREKNGSFILTLKEPHPTGLLETHDALTEQEAQDFLNGKFIEKANVTNRLNTMHIPIQSLVYYGKLTTERRETIYKNALLVLDHSMYNETADYELEVEAPSEQIGMQVFMAVLEQNTIERRDTPNKIERFFATL
ncbi:CYTH domain-containing protein [Virgibacillus dakarensis]|nr:CYTH domain-containing protein [Virgibacillus dakarensis]